MKEISLAVLQKNPEFAYFICILFTSSSQLVLLRGASSRASPCHLHVSAAILLWLGKAAGRGVRFKRGKCGIAREGGDGSRLTPRHLHHYKAVPTSIYSHLLKAGGGQK